MLADKLKWNERHGSRDGFNPPDRYLLDHQHELKPGSVLYLACGRGRNAFFLASEGFNVTGVDISDRGLQALQQEALLKGLNIRTVEMDLDEPELLLSLGQFDNVIIINFKPDSRLLQLIPSLLRDGGIFLMCSFNEKQSALNGFPTEKALHPDEFIAFNAELQLIDYIRFEDVTGHRDGYILKKL